MRAYSISQPGGFGLTTLTAVMYALQPLARLVGRLQLGLTPWRRRGTLRAGVVWPRTILSWSTTWRSIQVRLANIESNLRPNCMSVVRGGECDRWDIHVRLGSLAAARIRLTAEEHGQGQPAAPRARVAASFTRRERARRVPDCDVCAGGSPRRRPLGTPSRLCGHSPGAASDHGMRGRDGRHRGRRCGPRAHWTGRVAGAQRDRGGRPGKSESADSGRRERPLAARAPKLCVGSPGSAKRGAAARPFGAVPFGSERRRREQPSAAALRTGALGTFSGTSRASFAMSGPTGS